MAASLIERLPDQDDPRRPAEEKLVQDVVVVSFIGRYNVNGLEMDDHFSSPLSGGYDTVSRV